jgi:hypothetical protein
MRVSLRFRRRLCARNLLLQGRHLDLPVEAAERAVTARPSAPLFQYVVVNESIFPFAGHDRFRTARSTHDATCGLGGFV